ncbi:hypothetical protein WJX72_002696 [[Myrmecia] bisecta]|uniref:Survival of motor neuron-related-splicing factor 30 n=1 Tax=[Myrmecia] bisecta TaxID=41462 RepID=A0AAW1PGS9_9CHLO
MSLQSPEELQANLQEYRDQQQQVEELLLNEPNNAEYADIYKSLTEVIELTEDLLREAAASQPEPGQAPPQPSAAEPSGGYPSTSAPAAPVIEQAPSLQLPSVLPPQVAEQIRSAQQKAALKGQAPAAWAIGARCQAVYSADGEYYQATVTGVSATGNFVVTFDAYGNSEEVDRANVRAGPEVEEVYRGVSAPKRKRVDEETTAVEMPKWLEIKPTDDEKTKQKKKKLQKSYKSKMRFHKMDVETKQRAQAWQDFAKGKGSKKKTGFLTGAKKGSMFSVPEGVDAKVGVVGSGKGLTEYKKPARHDFVQQQ